MTAVEVALLVCWAVAIVFACGYLVGWHKGFDRHKEITDR